MYQHSQSCGLVDAKDSLRVVSQFYVFFIIKISKILHIFFFFLATTPGSPLGFPILKIFC